MAESPLRVAFSGKPILIEYLPDPRAVRGKLRSGGLSGASVHAGSFLWERRIVLDSALARSPAERDRILAHEIFHFVWWKLGRSLRASYEALISGEFAARVPGELGWSAEWRKVALPPASRRERTRLWREYLAESFCDSAAAALSRPREASRVYSPRRCPPYATAVDGSESAGRESKNIARYTFWRSAPRMQIAKSVFPAVAVGMTLAAAILLGWTACGSTPPEMASAKLTANGDGTRKAAPDFELKDSDGRTVRLSDYKGKVIVLDFWATWCSPCKVEIPWFQEFERKNKDRGFAVLGVAMDDGGWNTVKPFLKEFKVNYRVMMGDDQTADRFGGIEALPTTLLIDRSGRIASTHVGLVSKKDFENAIEQLLQDQRSNAGKTPERTLSLDGSAPLRAAARPAGAKP